MAAIAQRYGMTAARLARNEWPVRERQPARRPPTCSCPSSCRARCRGAAPAADGRRGRKRARRRRRTRPRRARRSATSTSCAAAIRCRRSPRASACREAQLLKMNSLRNPDFLYEGQRLRIAGEAVAVTQAEAEVKVAAIDAARGEAQREGAAVEVVREETTRPIGTGEPTRGRPRSRGRGRHGSRDHAGSCDRGGAGGRERARAGVGGAGRRTEPGARPGVGVAGPGRFDRLPGARRRLDPRRGHRNARAVRRLAADSRRRSCAT